jgi:hypothetical protein
VRTVQDIRRAPVRILTLPDERHVGDAIGSLVFHPDPRGGIGVANVTVTGIRWTNGYAGPGFAEDPTFRFDFGRGRAVDGFLAAGMSGRRAQLLGSIDADTVAQVVPSNFVGFES